MTRVLATLTALGWLILGVVVVVHLRSQPPVTLGVMLEENLTDGVLRHGHVSGAWEPSVDGLVLSPGQSGSLTLAIPVADTTPVSLRLWVYGRPDVPIRISCDSPDHRPVTLATVDTVIQGAAFALEGCRFAPPNVPITFAATSSSSNQQLVLDKLVVFQGSPLRLAVPARAWILSFCLAVAIGTLLVRQTTWPWFVGAAAVSALMAIALPEGWTGSIKSAALVHLPLLLLWVAVPTLGSAARWTSALAVCSLAVTTRWNALITDGLGALPPDTLAVSALAEAMASPYDTAFREPLWVWIGWLSALVSGQPLVGLQLFSVVTSTLLAPLGMWVALRLTRSVPVAVTTGVLLAGHPTLILQSPDGLRTAFNAAMLASAVGIPYIESPRWRWHLASVAMAAATAMQFSSLYVMLMLLIAGWLYRRTVAELVGLVVVPLCVTTAVMTPHLLNNIRVHGDPLYTVNYHAAFYRNHEFVRLGLGSCTDCPTVEDLDQQGSYAGPPVTVREYIFGMHTAHEVVQRVVEGYARVYLVRGHYLWSLLGWDGWLLHAAYLLGVAALVIGRYWTPLLALVAPLNMTAFLVPIGLDARLVMTPVVMAMFAVAVTVGVLLGSRHVTPSSLTTAPSFGADPKLTPPSSPPVRRGVEPDARSFPGWVELVTCLAILIVALSVRLWGVHSLGYSHWDEHFFASTAERITLTSLRQAAPLGWYGAPGTSVSISAAWALTGVQPWAAFATSAVWSTLAVFFCWGLVRDTLGSRPAIIAATLLACSEFAVMYARMALAESMFLACFLAGLWAAWWAARTPVFWRFVCAGVVAGVATLAKYQGILLLPIAGCAALLTLSWPAWNAGRAAWWAYVRAIGLAAAGLATGFVAPVLLAWPWFVAPGQAEVLVSHFAGYGGSGLATSPKVIASYFLAWSAPTSLAAAAAGLALVVGRRHGLGGHFLVVAGTLYFCATLTYVAYPRLALPLVPIVCALAGAGVSWLYGRLTQRRRSWAAPAGVAMVVAFAAVEASALTKLLRIQTTGYATAAARSVSLAEKGLVLAKLQPAVNLYSNAVHPLCDLPVALSQLQGDRPVYLLVDHTWTWTQGAQEFMARNRNRLVLIERISNPLFDEVILQPAFPERFAWLRKGPPAHYRHIYVYEAKHGVEMPPTCQDIG